MRNLATQNHYPHPGAVAATVKGMKFLQPDGIKTDVRIAAWDSQTAKYGLFTGRNLDGRGPGRETLNQCLGWVCAVISEPCRKFMANFSRSLLPVKAPLSRASNRLRLESGLQPVQYHAGRRQGSHGHREEPPQRGLNHPRA